MLRSARALLLSLAALATVSSAARAVPLDKGACEGLSREREALVDKGVAGDMAKGPEWGKANLAAERMGEIARLIEVTEQLAFRCGRLQLARPDGRPLLKADDRPQPQAPGAKKAPVVPEIVNADPGAEPKKKRPARKKTNKKASDAGTSPPALSP